MSRVVIVHGGAGDVPEDRRALHVEGCRRAAEAGLEILRAGGSAMDAAVRAVEVLEDDPLFNAGTGACLTSAGTLELDASVMEGTELRAGGVASLPPFRHPIAIARAVLESGRHVLFAAEGAARFAIEHGFSECSAEEMITPAARERLAETLAGRSGRGWAGSTVGAVACDGRGRVAAATSTGGMVAKAPGRIGDTPIFGAGTFADDAAGACSATGVGEQILRFGLARHACELMRTGVPAQEAATASMAAFAKRVGGSGGLVLVDADGETGFARNTASMSWAVAREGQESRAGS